MGNMSYCRFENTLTDLEDCRDNMDDVKNLSHSERKCREKIIELCKEIASEYGREVE